MSTSASANRTDWRDQPTATDGDPHTEDYQRPRAEHIMFSFERSLGTFVKEHVGTATASSRIPQKIIDQIIAQSSQSSEERVTIEWLIENSYLDTLFALAHSAPDDPGLSSAAINLRKWCQAVGVFEIRNVIAHPNRPWIPHYWHTICALATHPIAFEMSLKEVFDSLRAAELGRFKPPPDSWRIRVAEMEIPNNLSDSIRSGEHDTFVGRRKERKKLTEAILKRKYPTYSIVGPGGLGKTALLLTCLQDLVRNHQARLEFDLILFLSSKSRMLTSSGEIDVRPDLVHSKNLQDQLSKAILKDPSATWNQLRDVYGESRLLLCLDNVESILLDTPNPIDELIQQDGFPGQWTVVLTSRIAVRSTFEIQIGPMNCEDKEALAASYSNTVGVSLSKDERTNIAARADSPLALRIWIDFLVQGHPQDSAFERTNKLTAMFAYAKLLGALGEDIRTLIEALFVIDQPVGDAQLVVILDWEVSRIKGVISTAIRHSLIDREPQGGKLTLRDALLLHLSAFKDDEQQILDTRKRLQEQWDRYRREETVVGGLDLEGSVSSEPQRNLEDVDDAELKSVLFRMLRLMDTTSFRAKEALNTLDNIGQWVPAVHRVAALVHEKRGDITGAERSLKEALRLNEWDWRAALLLAHSLRDRGLYNDAIECTRPFIENEDLWDGPGPAGDRFVYLYYTSRIWWASDRITRGMVEIAKDDLRKVVEETGVWRTADVTDDREQTLAGLHAMALRRSVEHVATSSEERAKALSRALDVYRDLFNSDSRLTGRTASELQDLLEQFLYLYNGTDGEAHVDQVKCAVALVAKNMDTLLADAPTHKADSLRIIMGQFRRVSGGSLVTQISDETWLKWGVESDDEGTNGLATKIISTGPHFLLAEDDGGICYYVRPAVVALATDYSELEVGMPLLVWPDHDVKARGRGIPVRRAILKEDDTSRFSDSVVTWIYSIPATMSGVVFSRDTQRTQYYVHASITKLPAGSSFDELEIGTKLLVWPDYSTNQSRSAVTASRAEVL